MAITFLTSINIVRQAPQSCRGQHVDPEYTPVNGVWELTDRNGTGPVVESVQRWGSESDQEFYARVSQRASEIDRELACSRCYR